MTESSISWSAAGFDVGDFVAMPTLLVGDAVVLIVGRHDRLGWTLMGDDGSTAVHMRAPEGTRRATEDEVAAWRARWLARSSLGGFRSDVP